MALSKIQSKKALYKKALAALLAGTMGMGIAGCSNSNEGTQPDTKEQTTEVNEDPKEEEFKLPSETMSVEETQGLTAGTIISFDDTNKIPDEATLEGMNLTAIYRVEKSLYDKDGVLLESGVEALYGVLPAELADDSVNEKAMNDGYVSQEQWIGMKIAEIYAFDQNANGEWIKVVMNDNHLIEGTPVVSEQLLNELQGPQKVK